MIASANNGRNGLVFINMLAQCPRSRRSHPRALGHRKPFPLRPRYGFRRRHIPYPQKPHHCGPIAILRPQHLPRPQRPQYIPRPLRKRPLPPQHTQTYRKLMLEINSPVPSPLYIAPQILVQEGWEVNMTSLLNIYEG